MHLQVSAAQVLKLGYQVIYLNNTLIYMLLAATPPSGRLFLLVPAESFFGPSALIIKF